MKKFVFITVPLLLMFYLMALTLIPRTNQHPAEVIIRNAETQNEENKNLNRENNNVTVPPDHFNEKLDCKTCHACEYPTIQDPCLISCPRENMLTGVHTSKEGPETVVINEMSNLYEGVVFSHKIHSQMSEISMGCTGCHHYNTTGPVLSCRKCHESNRTRDDVSIPDLKAAFHRQCMTCHKQWSGENGCNSQCHLRKDPTNEISFQESIKKMSGKTHPIQPKPSKMIWQTNYEKGKVVTFFHDEHVELFKLSCSNCHSNDNCFKCHSTKIPKDSVQTINIKKPEEEHHKPCNDCHNMNVCNKCHEENEMLPFNHGRSAGWSLKSYHSKLACTSCHGNQVPIKKLDNNCTSCHKNFVPGKFDHKLTGLVLSDNHKDFECNNCHSGGDFSKPPVCNDCHDDKSYPKNLPGVRK